MKAMQVQNFNSISKVKLNNINGGLASGLRSNSNFGDQYSPLHQGANEHGNNPLSHLSDSKNYFSL